MSVLRGLVLLAPLALMGCSFIDGLLSDNKIPLEGRREVIAVVRRGLSIDITDGSAVVIAPAQNIADWPQMGGSPAHTGANIAVSGLTPAWRADVGSSGGYRDKILAVPVVAGGRVFTMDADALVSAFDLQTGSRQWRTDTQDKEDRSTNVGGGVAVDGGTVYVTTGRADVLALDAATGAIRWRKPIGSPARSAPTVANGRVLVTTIDTKLVALDAKTGERAWQYQGNTIATTLLGLSAPAVADGLVVAGFGSGEIVAVREDSGALAWSDSLASARGRNSLVDLSAVRGLPVIDQGRVYAIGAGGLLLSLDLRTGRRLWEREVGGTQTPWLVGDWLFVQTSDQALVAIRTSDGRLRWVTDLPRFENEAKKSDVIFWTGPVLVGNKLVLAGSNEQAVSVNPVTGKVLGLENLRGAATVTPVAAAGTLLILTEDATLQAFR